MTLITLVVAMCILCMAQAARALPTGCGEDEHCPSGFFCEATTLFCQECLSCENLKREQQVEATSCVTSAFQCGACLPGLVENRGGDAVCVPPDTRGEGLALPLPAYGWAVIVLILTLCAMLLCVAAAYVLRNFETFKILASTRASVHTPVATSGMADTVVQQPPPYNILSALAPGCPVICDEVHTPVATSDMADTVLQQPPPYNISSTLAPGSPVICDEESSWPFIKAVPLPQYTEERENALNQAASVYNNPTYVRGAPTPPSYEVEELGDVSPTQFNLHNDIENSNNNYISTNAAEREIPVLSAPTKLYRVRQDSNNSHSSGSSSGIGEEADHSGTFSPFTRNGSPVIINVIKNIAAAQQQNMTY